ncbi:hypothetical protein TNCV_315591 [Trichonephila clavipes]|nr:hypothetical protein TNCV_315591 [Trichonephila clavipes]
MSAKFVVMDYNAHPHRTNIVNECLQLEDITRMEWLAFLHDLDLIGVVRDRLARGIKTLSTTSYMYTETSRDIAF